MVERTSVAPDDETDRDHRDGGTAAPEELDVRLPDDSLLTRDEYLEMYRVASSEPAFSVLCALSEAERLSASELSRLLDREGNDLHYHLRKLKRAGLVRNRRDPTTGTEETYSYYTLTGPGQTVLTNGLKRGIEQLAADERTIAESYDG